MSREEFEMLEEAALEAGFILNERPMVERVFLPNNKGRTISAILWGETTPELIFLHGGAQNAHTWDSVIMALGKPAVAVDLPGHGLSDWRDDHAYSPANLAEDIMGVIVDMAPQAKGVVGMSLGGLTSIMMTDLYEPIVRKLMLVDITPGVTREKAEPILEFIDGPVEFPSFEEILSYTQKYNPQRSEKSLIRGIKNNAKEIDGGKWTWRWDPGRAKSGDSTQPDPMPVFSDIWDAFERVKIPIALYRGGDSEVVDDSDVEQVMSRQPETQVVEISGAGHSIQGDKPLELADCIKSFIE